MSRIRIAAAMPTSVAKPSEACWACSTACPPSATCSVDERTDSAVEMTRLTAVFASASAR
jgi:hypothetical protein